MSFYGGNPIVNNFTISTSNFKTFVETFTATEGQTVFTFINTYEIGANRLEVYVDGVQQHTPTNYTETTTNSITLAEGVSVGTEVLVEITQIQ